MTKLSELVISDKPNLLGNHLSLGTRKSRRK